MKVGTYGEFETIAFLHVVNYFVSESAIYSMRLTETTHAVVRPGQSSQTLWNVFDLGTSDLERLSKLIVFGQNDLPLILMLETFSALQLLSSSLDSKSDLS